MGLVLFKRAQRKGRLGDMGAVPREAFVLSPYSPLRPKAWVELYPDNGLVTDWYIHSICDVLGELGVDIEYCDD